MISKRFKVLVKLSAKFFGSWTKNDVKLIFTTPPISEADYFLLLLKQVIVKASSGPRYVVGCRNKVDKTKLIAGMFCTFSACLGELIFIAGTRVSLDMTTLTIMRYAL